MSRCSPWWRENELAFTLSTQMRWVNWLGTWLLPLSPTPAFRFWWRKLPFFMKYLNSLRLFALIHAWQEYTTCWLPCLPVLLSAGCGSSWPMSVPSKPLEVAFYCHRWVLVRDGRRGSSIAGQAGSPGDWSHTGLPTCKVFSALSVCSSTSCNS